MKKILLIILSLTILLTLTACGEKTKAVTQEDFKSKLKTLEYTVDDRTDEVQKDTGIIEYYLAKAPRDIYMIEYFKLDSKDRAKQFYDDLQAKASSNKAEASVERTEDTKNTNRYVLENGELFYTIIRVDDTLLYVSSETGYKHDIEKALIELGY